MSWDVSICRFGRQYETMEEIPNDERCYPLGTRVEIHAAISRSFPGTDWSDPAWGVWESPFGSIEFSIGNDDPVEGVMLHVRANEAVVHPIIELCLDQEWQAFDMSNGTFLEKSAVPEAGLRGWHEFKTRVLRQ
ncbi:hypothetical protein [Rhodoferax sp. TH121]|uniref:hypothetical protein n=1 Tax=Rhodoferax sp. TH121 TaxID=2022803 RepID=UPI00113FE696|nr:hypothetical protein [Rhodoferax sp. TH121]